MKLRGRFTLTLALAALVPIALAAVVTTRVIASSYRERYAADRAATQQTLKRELARLEKNVSESATSLAGHDNPFVGGMLLDYVKGDGQLDADAQRRLREQSLPLMRGLSLDILTITGPDDVIQVSPHYRAKVGDVDKVVRERAAAHAGSAYYVRDSIMNGRTKETVLAVESAQLSRYQGYTVALWAGRRVGDDLVSPLRTTSVDARIVAPDGSVLLPPAGKDWAKLAKDDPIREPLRGPDGVPIAIVEVAVSDGGLDQLLRDITLTSALLALGALGAVVLTGLFVARRTARDLDRLVEGSLAASRGDLDHRVPVRSKDEVGAVAAAFNFMMEDLKTSKEKLVIAERIAAWQDIARRLAHEIKNPLTPIQMAMDTLRKSWKKQHPSFEEILEESTRTVLEEADRLKKIVAEFSDFARMPKPELARIDLNEVVRYSLSLYQGAVKVDSNLAPDVPEIDGDKGQLQQVLLNLVENARDALGKREDGRILVTTKRGEANDRLFLVVEDNGPGVPPELKDKVFAPYFTTKQAKGGTGLGLAIVHRIVSDHGGRITISDARDRGARFTIELPLRSGAALLASRI
ncbi:MAG: HAMP domain-containing protein [Kofleriaceae bacterium]|nr:HAMP domain-containing protein [Kofleriaceae bacterium]